MKIISGGQTGIDRLGLEVAKLVGLETGGFAPYGWLTENGPDLSLKDFNLVECLTPGYPARTRKNAYVSQATFWFGIGDSPGYKCTAAACSQYGRMFIPNPTAQMMLYELADKPWWTVINIAGNRGSRCSKDFLENTELILTQAFEFLKTLKSAPL